MLFSMYPIAFSINYILLMNEHLYCFCFSGAILVFYTLMMAGGALFLPCGIDSYVTLIQSLNLPDIVITVVKFLTAFPFAFHYFIGIRFVCFNMVKLLVLKEAYQSAYLAIGAAGAAAAAFAFLF